MNEFKDGITEQKQVLAVVESEAHFVEVGVQMLRTNTMARSNDSAIQKRECGLEIGELGFVGDGGLVFQVARVAAMPSAG